MPSAEITTLSKDGVFGYGPDGLRLGWDYLASDVMSWDFYHGRDADPALYSSGLTETQATVAKADLADGVQFFWKVVGHKASGSIISDVWSYQAKKNRIQGPCPDLPSVELNGQMIDTIEVNDRCWLARNLTVGEDETGTVYDDGRVQRTCMNMDCTNAVYSWWEAHNAYVAQPNQVPDDICPLGFRLPSRAEWDQLLADNINGLRFNPFLLHLDGHLVPQNGNVESCPDPANPMAMLPCVVMGSFSDTQAGYYWTNESSATTATRVVVRHEGGGNYTVSYSTPRPTFTAAIRCIRD